MERWPDEGVPDNPGAWLATTARRRAIDTIRRERNLARKTEQLDDPGVSPGADTDVGDPTAAIGDEVLALLFATCHPSLARGARVALTLRLFGGLTTDEIARALLVPSPTVGQRIARAKKRLADLDALGIPAGEELEARVSSVLEVIYLVFTEGHTASSGDDWVRPALCTDAMRLGRVLTRLLPRHPEAFGLLALMELQASRLRARTGPDGRALTLEEQDRGRWDRLLIAHGLDALDRAESLGRGRGRYTLQAAIAACHARARSVADTDWSRMAALYDELATRAPSPVVELNRAVVVGRAAGPAAGLEVLDRLRDDPALAGHHLVPAVRADLLTSLERHGEAAVELERAVALARTAAERDLLRRRLDALPGR